MAEARAGGKAPSNGKAWKSRAIDLGFIGAILLTMQTLHTAIVLPRTMAEGRKIAREEMESRMAIHERHIGTRFDAVDQRLDSIDERLRHIERKGK